MKSEDPNLRGLAIWAVTPIANIEAIQPLKQLADDPARLMLYQDGQLAQYSVGHLARDALTAIRHRAKDERSADTSV
jgi:hypothetical protein